MSQSEPLNYMWTVANFSLSHYEFHPDCHVHVYLGSGTSNSRGHFYWHGLTLIPMRINNYMHYKVWAHTCKCLLQPPLSKLWFHCTYWQLLSFKLTFVLVWLADFHCTTLALNVFSLSLSLSYKYILKQRNYLYYKLYQIENTNVTRNRERWSFDG